MKIFISSTFQDLIAHRTAVNEILSRMKLQISAMELFGSRTDEISFACEKEIYECDIFIGIYAWRYGWQRESSGISITEEEFNFARANKKRCLCYVIDEKHPWPPLMVEQGEAGNRLKNFKREVSRLVRSTFTTPDNLAKQIAADLARELAPPTQPDSFGTIIRLNWGVFSPDLQMVLSTAYSQAIAESDDGVVATRHVISALANTVNTASSILAAFQNVPIQPLKEDLTNASLLELFGYDKPISSCVLASMNRLLPYHSPSQRLLAIELAVDLLKNGTGSSVADFRYAGIDADAVEKTYIHITKVANDKKLLREAIGALSDAELLHIAYLSQLRIPENASGTDLREQVLNNANEDNRILLLVGELMRRHPKFVTFS